MASLDGRWVSTEASAEPYMLKDGSVYVLGAMDAVATVEVDGDSVTMTSAEGDVSKGALAGPAINWEDGEVWTRFQDPESPKTLRNKRRGGSFKMDDNKWDNPELPPAEGFSASESKLVVSTLRPCVPSPRPEDPRPEEEPVASESKLAVSSTLQPCEAFLLDGRWVSTDASAEPYMLKDGSVYVLGAMDAVATLELGPGPTAVKMTSADGDVSTGELAVDGAAINWEDGEIWTRFQDPGSPKTLRSKRKRGSFKMDENKWGISPSGASLPPPAEGFFPAAE